MDTVNAELGICRVKTIKNRGLLLKCQHPDEFKKLAGDKNLGVDYDIHNLKTSMPRLRTAGISVDINEQQLIQFLTKQNKDYLRRIF